jgi:integrase
MSVKRRKDGRWRVDVCVRQGEVRVRERAAAKTREEGYRLESEIRARLQRGEQTAKKPPTFEDWAREFQEVYAATNNKPSERRAKLQIIRDHLGPFFRDTRIDRIGVPAIERFKAEQLKAEAAPKSINNRLTVLRRMLAVAQEWGRISSVPKIEWMAVGEQGFRFLSFDEAVALTNAANEWRPMVLLGLRAGLRNGELLALQWDHVDLVNGRINVCRSVWRGVEGTPKGGRSRIVPLSPEAADALRSLPSRFRKGYVFGDGVTRLTAGETKWPLWSACKRAGIARCGWHVLRHTFASHLVMRGVVLKAVQELLGHATIEMTMRYAHLAPAVKEDAVTRLDGHVPNGTRSEAV